MTDLPASSTFWGVSGEEAVELMRLHREQIVMYEGLLAALEDRPESEARHPRELTLDDLDEKVRELLARYERSRPGIRLTPLRYITIGGPEGSTAVGSADLPHDGLVSLMVTETIAGAERVAVTSRVLVAAAVTSREQPR